MPRSFTSLPLVWKNSSRGSQLRAKKALQFLCDNGCGVKSYIQYRWVISERDRLRLFLLQLWAKMPEWTACACGNECWSERPWWCAFMVNPWVDKRISLDGFRSDLMGTHDISRNLLNDMGRSECTIPPFCIYEGWAAVEAPVCYPADSFSK